MQAVSFVTTERQHLFAMTAALIDGISPEFMRSAADPVVVTVRGTVADGKKIIPDAAVQKIFDIPNARQPELYRKKRRWGFSKNGKPHFKGKPEYDEYWTGGYEGESIEVGFVNVAWTYGYFDDRLEEVPSSSIVEDERFEIAKAFLKTRRYGGVSFVHNSHKAAEEKAWIDIWVERQGNCVVGNAEHRSTQAPESLRNIFRRKSAKSDDWTRFIRVDVKHEKLLESDRFAKAFDFLQSNAPVFL